MILDFNLRDMVLYKDYRQFYRPTIAGHIVEVLHSIDEHGDYTVLKVLLADSRTVSLHEPEIRLSLKKATADCTDCI